MNIPRVLRLQLFLPALCLVLTACDANEPDEKGTYSLSLTGDVARKVSGRATVSLDTQDQVSRVSLVLRHPSEEGAYGLHLHCTGDWLEKGTYTVVDLYTNPSLDVDCANRRVHISYSDPSHGPFAHFRGTSGKITISSSSSGRAQGELEIRVEYFGGGIPAISANGTFDAVREDSELYESS